MNEKENNHECGCGYKCEHCNCKNEKSDVNSLVEKKNQKMDSYIKKENTEKSYD